MAERIRLPLEVWEELSRVAGDQGLKVADLAAQLIQGGLPFYETVTRRAG